MPKIVAPIGSSNAMVAVSKDFRFDKEEKYNVCANAVGIMPKPTKGSKVSMLAGNCRALLVAGKLMAATTAAVSRYVGIMVGSTLI